MDHESGHGHAGARQLLDDLDFIKPVAARAAIFFRQIATKQPDLASPPPDRAGNYLFPLPAGVKEN